MVESLSGGQLYHAKFGLLVGLLILTVFLIVSAFKTLLATRADILLQGKHDNDDYIDTKDLSDCLGAPYLYVTVHDITANILKYTRDGCFLSSDVLIMGRGTGNNDVEFRSMAFGKYEDEDVLFITDASNINSRLMVFGSCLKTDINYGRRPFIETVVESSRNAGVSHTYGVCHDKKGNVYISNQHTDCVLRFRVDDFRPMVLPLSLQLDRRLDYYDGTFVQFGLPGGHGRDHQGVRAIASVKANIWIAHEDLGGVAIVDTETGLVSNVVPMAIPVGLHYDESIGLVFVSCKSKDKKGTIYAVDHDTYEVLHTYSHHKMKHPTGSS
jgi:hypothetical protein